MVNSAVWRVIRRRRRKPSAAGSGGGDGVLRLTRCASPMDTVVDCFRSWKFVSSRAISEFGRYAHARGPSPRCFPDGVKARSASVVRRALLRMVLSKDSSEALRRGNRWCVMVISAALFDLAASSSCQKVGSGSSCVSCAEPEMLARCSGKRREVGVGGSGGAVGVG